VGSAAQDGNSGPASGRIFSFSLKPGLYRIGRHPDNSVCIDDTTVSQIHAEAVVTPETITVTDLGSTNGTFLNNTRLQSFVVRGSDTFRLGEALVMLSIDEAGQDIPELNSETRQSIHTELIVRMNQSRLKLTSLSETELAEHTRKHVLDILTERFGKQGSRHCEAIISDVLGLGPIEPFLADPSVTEIMVNGPSKIYVERGGRLTITGKCFLNEQQVRDVIERIVMPLGRRIDESSPVVDARLKDGSRVNAVIPPLSLTGPVLTIRKFSKHTLRPEDLVSYGSATEAMLDYLKQAVVSRKNIIISGGTGSGKTTLLNILSSFIPADERIITVEDAAELKLSQEHVVSLEARPPNIEGTGAVTIRDLVRNTLRMRPDRIIVGECRGGEALDMLQAMNTGHDGSLTTGHANTPADMIRRLETMVLMSGVDLPVRVIREQIASAVDIFIQQSRLPGGGRKIVSICEVRGITGDAINLREIFYYNQETGSFCAETEGDSGIPAH